MNKIVLQNIIRFVVLIFFQISVLNNIYLGGYVNLFLYILFILMLPTYLPKNVIILISFATGFIVDIFSTTLGLHTFSATLIGFSRVVFADKILTKGDNVEIDTPSIRTISPSVYSAYAIILTFIYCFFYYLIESFSLHDILNLLIRTVLSTIVTYLLMIACQFLFINQKKK